MKQRIQNRIIARSVNATVVMFVIQLFLLFDKNESGELGEPSESGEPSDSTDSTDSTDYSMTIHDNLCENSESIVHNNPKPNGFKLSALSLIV